MTPRKGLDEFGSFFVDCPFVAGAIDLTGFGVRVTSGRERARYGGRREEKAL